MVRKDMVNNMVGYRTASIGDAWMGPSRFSPEMRKAVADVATLIMGRNTFKVLVTAEKSWKAGISVAKQTIVIRSVIVPMANLASNVLQAATNGVPVRSIAKGFATKLIEIDHHLKNLDRLVEINALLARYRDDVFETRKLLAEQKALEDASRRMSIWPLIEAGEFATISEGLTEADAAIAQGKWVDYMPDREGAEQAGHRGRYGFVTRYAALSEAGDPVERLPAVVEFEVSCCVLPDIRNFGRRNMFVWIFLGVVGLLVILTLPPVAKAVRTGTDIVNFLIFAMAIAFILWLALAM